MPDEPPHSVRKTSDIYNSSSTGHQIADNRLTSSVSWRQSRTLKLGEQFRGGDGGGKRMSDTVGAGSMGFGRNGRKANGGWEKGAARLRKGVGGDIKAWMSGKGTINNSMGKGKKNTNQEPSPKIGQPEENVLLKDPHSAHSPLDLEEQPPQIFANLNVYINGSTYPVIGDHRLKQLLATHGATVNISLARRTITHVILGTPNTRLKDKDYGLGGKEKVRIGAGGGLAASKIEKEIKRIRGESVKFVGVEWVVESVKAGRRLPEVRFSNLSTAGAGQGSVYRMFKATKKKDDAPGSGKTDEIDLK
ncbi:MAG: hypothetical protein MMC33_002709 [Icmadophila ericetorum]|nr:hypothetical protein [Icmadophila ericetorum]